MFKVMANIPGIHVKYTRMVYNSFHGLTAPSFFPKIEAKKAVRGTETKRKQIIDGLSDKASKNCPSVILIFIGFKYSFLNQ